MSEQKMFKINKTSVGSAKKLTSVSIIGGKHSIINFLNRTGLIILKV